MQLKTLLFIAFSGITSQLPAQQCFDTVRIRGYHIYRYLKKDLEYKTRPDGSRIMEEPEGNEDGESYIPLDSISANRPLLFWLNNFYYDTKTVFIKCAYCLSIFRDEDCMGLFKNDQNQHGSPSMYFEKFYQTPGPDTVHIYAISYLDAYWAKIPIERGTARYDRLFFFKTINQWIKPEVKTFYVLGFLRTVVKDLTPDLEDPSLIVWKP